MFKIFKVLNKNLPSRIYSLIILLTYNISSVVYLNLRGSKVIFTFWI